MGGLRRWWKDTGQYKRILEILEDYWVTEKDEFRVRVSMDFIKANGETQTKQITWQNPNYYCETQPESLEECVIDLSELVKMSDFELYQRDQKKFYHTGKIIRRTNNDYTV